MPQYDKIDISEGTDINKTSASKECDICHYRYFLNKNYNYEPYLCNGCHDLMRKAVNFDDVTIVSIKGNDYRIHFWYMSVSITYYETNRDAILNRANNYYENNKKLLKEKAKNKYRELSEEEKNIRREYERNRYHKMFEKKQQKLKEHQKNYCEAKKSRKGIVIL